MPRSSSRSERDPESNARQSSTIGSASSSSPRTDSTGTVAPPESRDKRSFCDSASLALQLYGRRTTYRIPFASWPRSISGF
eukprot:6205962-Pleurochrysis_carterae.AAC.2